MGLGGTIPQFGGAGLSLGSNGTFWCTGYDVLPRLTGSHDNDWLTLPVEPVGRGWRQGRGGLADKERLYQVWCQVSIDSGAGSNTWKVEMVWVPNTDEEWQSWEVFTPPHGPFGIAHPVLIDSADLPQDYRFTVPMGYGPWCLKFTRSGAGTNELLVRTWIDRL